MAKQGEIELPIWARYKLYLVSSPHINEDVLIDLKEGETLESAKAEFEAKHPRFHVGYKLLKKSVQTFLKSEIKESWQKF
jgi:hypothetical protein